MLAKRTYKNQITIPKEIVKQFTGVEYFDVAIKGEDIILHPVEVRRRGEILESVTEKIRKLGLTERDIEAAIRWAREKK